MTELTQEQMDANKERYCQLLHSVAREGCNIDGLIDYLDRNHFFIKPASTKYHGSIDGGLCAHSLMVYDNMDMIVKSKGLTIDDDTVILCALLHDLSKTIAYKKSVSNKKVYYDGAPKHDACGDFEWISVMEWKTIPDDEQTFFYGNHEETSLYLARCFIRLKTDEEAAILNHHAGMGWDSAQNTPTKVISTNQVAALLHIADSMAAFVDRM